MRLKFVVLVARNENREINRYCFLGKDFYYSFRQIDKVYNKWLKLKASKLPPLFKEAIRETKFHTKKMGEPNDPTFATWWLGDKSIIFMMNVNEKHRIRISKDKRLNELTGSLCQLYINLLGNNEQFIEPFLVKDEKN